MAANWHPSDGFEPLATRLFIGASYASVARYPMDDRDIIDIGLHIIKCCGMYSEENKNWIAHENKTLAIVETINSFKEYCTNTIALVNQMAVPASQHGYGMAWMMTHCLHHTASHLRILVLRTPPRKNQSRPKQPAWPLCKAN
jgi:hypothetical protein